jgi:hypothetical protein
MGWVAVWIAVMVVGALGLVASANSIRFDRRVGREVQQMWTGAAAPLGIDRGRIDELPAPAGRYLALAIGDRARAVGTVRLRHHGTFRPKLEGGWLPIRGRQYFAADPPGFVWWGRVQLAPGLWIDARDRCVEGAGSMYVSAESSATIGQASGPAIDQGALLRLLAEMAWFPTALLDRRYVSWAAVDERRARVTLRVEGHEVSGVFEFGEDGLPVAFFAERHRDLGGGQSALTPWSGAMADFRRADGMLVPHEMTAYWHIDGGRVQYARFVVERLEYDAAAPF